MNRTEVELSQKRSKSSNASEFQMDHKWWEEQMISRRNHKCLLESE